MVLDTFMPLNQELLNELKEILRKDYGKELSREELFEIGSTLISYFELLARIYFRKEKKEFDSSQRSYKIS